MTALARRKAAPARGPQARRKTEQPTRAAIRIKRVYDPPARGDGLRVLIDRLWPRGLSRQALELGTWAKELAPSHELRRWYGHRPEHFAEFRRRYLAELEGARAPLDELRAAMRGRAVTLLTATRELELSHATVLREVLQGKE